VSAKSAKSVLVRTFFPSSFCASPSDFRALLWRKRGRSCRTTLSPALACARCRGRRLFVAGLPRRQIDHVLSPLVQVARALGVLLCHVGIMDRKPSGFQRVRMLPYSNWPTTDSGQPCLYASSRGTGPAECGSMARVSRCGSTP